MRLVGLAARNVIRQGRRSLLLGGAAAFGVLVMGLAGALTAGFSAAALDNLSLSLGGHVRVSGFTASASGRWQNRMDRPPEERLQALARWPEVVSLSAQASAPGTVVFGTKEVRVPFLGVEGAGVELFERGLTLVSGSWKGWPQPRGMVLDSASATRLGLGQGDQVLVRMATASGQQNLVEYQVVAVYDTVKAGGRAGVVVSLTDLATDLNLRPGEVPSIVVTLADAVKAPDVAERLSSMTSGWAPQVDVTTVQDTMGQLATILMTLHWLSVAVFLIMLALVAGGVANTFRMVLLERVKEIGTLRCLGMQRGSVLALFLAEAGLVTTLGGLAGALASGVVGWGLEAIPSSWVASAGLVLRQGHLPVSPDWAVGVGAITAVAVVGVVAAWGPARRAAGLDPARALAWLS